MPKILSRALTEPRCRAIKPVPGKTLKLVDGDGLQLLVRPTGRKVWELRLQHAGRERTATLGTYPDLTLAAARSAAAAERVEARLTPRDAFVPSLSFEDAFEDWMKVKEVGLKNGYAQDIRERLTFNALPDLRTKPLRAISRQDVIAVLKKIADRGAHVQARRVRALLAEMFEWAAINELMGDNPAPKALLKTLPKTPSVGHHAAASLATMPAVMKRFTAYPSTITGAALRFVVLTAARTNEVRLAQWSEVDLSAGVWSIPAERMKAGREHRVPLSAAAITLLRELPRVSQHWVFPTLRADRPMSNNAMLYALKAMGFEFTVHGFRSTFSTWANESRAAEPDVIEAALAHIVPGVKGAYDRGTRFEQRRALMEKWAVAITN